LDPQLRRLLLYPAELRNPTLIRKVVQNNSFFIKQPNLFIFFLLPTIKFFLLIFFCKFAT
ncbi:MAG TPA: hypothetical protein P5206_04385, partial [Paludibacteraceae bacterium]|nr:hypothetical protein [Paludibacteraceae bacterium]